MADEGIIVLAEDDAILRRLYADSLSVAGFRVLAAADGEEALELLSKVTPRLVILDIMMPNLNGIETCKRARNIIGGKIPILFLSALDRIDILNNCMTAGGDDYMIKSNSIASLIERIRTWLRRAPQINLTARREKMLHDISAKLSDPDGCAPSSLVSSEDEDSVENPSEDEGTRITRLLSLVNEALQHAKPGFGKSQEDKMYLTGYIAGILEYESEANGCPEEMFQNYLQMMLNATQLVTSESASETSAAYAELSKNTRFQEGHSKGRGDAFQRQTHGSSFQMTGLAPAGTPDNAQGAAG